MKLRLEGDRIVGYGSFGTKNPKSIYIEYDWVGVPEVLKDEYGRHIYRWDGNNPILDPIAPAAQEIQDLKDKKIRKQIKIELSEILQSAASFNDIMTRIQAIKDSF
jgi:hypothetical protein